MLHKERTHYHTNITHNCERVILFFINAVWHRTVWYKSTDIFEVQNASIFRTEIYAEQAQHVYPKCQWTSITLHSIASQKTVLLTVTAVRSSSPTQWHRILVTQQKSSHRTCCMLPHVSHTWAHTEAPSYSSHQEILVPTEHTHQILPYINSI